MRLALSEVCLHLVNSISTARDPVHHLSWILLVPNWSCILLVPNRSWILLVLNWSWILDSPRAKLILDPGFSLCQIDPGSSLCQIDPGSWILLVPNRSWILDSPRAKLMWRLQNSNGELPLLRNGSNRWPLPDSLQWLPWQKTGKWTKYSTSGTGEGKVTLDQLIKFVLLQYLLFPETQKVFAQFTHVPCFN